MLEKKEQWMVELWQPLLDQILEIYQDYDKGKSSCNIILLTTERDFFSEFEKHFLEPAFKELRYADRMSGYWLEHNIDEVNEKVIFLNFGGVRWFTKNTNSLRKFLEIARQHRKFLILCVYDYMLSKFRQCLGQTFVGEIPPEVKELRLKLPGARPTSRT